MKTLKEALESQGRLTEARLPLDRVAVKVETEEESRAVQERYFALGKKWMDGSPEVDLKVPKMLGNPCLTTGGSWPGYLGWTDAGDVQVRGDTILSAAAFLAAYPAPEAKPKYAYLKDWTPGERVRHVVEGDGTVMALDEKQDRFIDFWGDLMYFVPVRLDRMRGCSHCWHASPDRLTRIAPEPNPEPEPEAQFKIYQRDPDPCPRCGLDTNVTGNLAVDGVVVGCSACLRQLLTDSGWIKPPRKQTRAEALEALRAQGIGPRPSEIAHKKYPRGGDR